MSGPNFIEWLAEEWFRTNTRLIIRKEAVAMTLKNNQVLDDFIIKDSGVREEHKSGMVRDTAQGKTDWERIYNGPMAERWAIHLTKGCQKYPDAAPGVPNWTLAEGNEEMIRAKKSAARHFAQWLKGDVDEDHAAAVFFNINETEYIKQKMRTENCIKTFAEETHCVVDQQATATPLSKTPVPWRSLTVVVAVVIGFLVGSILSFGMSSAGRFVEGPRGGSQPDASWTDRYQQYQNSSSLQELRLNQERDSLRHRSPC